MTFNDRLCSREHNVDWIHFLSKSGAIIKHVRFSARKSCFSTQNGQKFGGALKLLYLCIVNRNDGIGAQGTKNLFSGLTKFSPCPERKKEVENGDNKQKPITNKKTKQTKQKLN